jgi:hypothetical protein
MLPDLCSMRMPIAAAVNSSTLFDILSGMFVSGIRQALPDDTKYPPIPDGHASVMVMLVGSLVVMRLKLIPLCALSKIANQNDNNLESRELILRVLLSCFPFR